MSKPFITPTKLLAPNKLPEKYRDINTALVLFCPFPKELNKYVDDIVITDRILLHVPNNEI